MKITEVRIKLMSDPNDRLQAFCSVTFDSAFVVRDLKIIQGTRGPFVAMPSRKLTDRCGRCSVKNELRSNFCNSCGSRLGEDRAARDDSGRARLYADIAHPIKSECREMIQSRVLQAYDEELIRAQQPGYVCHYDDYGEDSFATMVNDVSTPALVANGPGDTSRRIEPAAANQNKPHHTERSRPAEKRCAADSDYDGFGVGVE